MNSLRTHYDREHDRWLIDSWLVLLPAQIDAARLHVLKTQRQRLAGMPPGDRRDVAAKSSEPLYPGRIFPRPTPNPGDRAAPVCPATPGTGKIIIGA